MNKENALYLITLLECPDKNDTPTIKHLNEEEIIETFSLYIEEYIVQKRKVKLQLALGIIERILVSGEWKLKRAVQNIFVPRLVKALKSINRRKRETVVRLFPIFLYSAYLNKVYTS